MVWAGWRMPWRALGCALLAVVVAGCDVLPTYKSPIFPFADSFSPKPNSAPVLLSNEAWWRKFNDPVLNALIEEALAGNLDLALARERVLQAQAQAVTVPSQLTVNGSLRAGAGGSRTTSTREEGEADLSLGWLFDPWGGRRAQVLAAEGQVEVAAAELDAARLLVLSTVATAYIDLRFFQRSLHLRQGELSSRQQTLGLIRDLQQGNAATRLEMVRAEALVAQSRAQIPELRTAVRAQENRLAVLLGRTPGRAVPALNGSRKVQPRASMPADVGIPADLLRNRPDIRITERLYYVALAEIGTEKALLYPGLSLSGELSLSRIGGVSGTDYFFGPSLRLPALPNGPQHARVRVRESQARQAHTTWQSSVLQAIEQAESALVRYAGSQSSVGAAQETVRLYRQSVSLTRELLGRDGATIRDLLEDEQSVSQANILLAQTLRQAAQDFVTLNTSLGSGHAYAGKLNVSVAE